MRPPGRIVHGGEHVGGAVSSVGVVSSVGGIFECAQPRAPPDAPACSPFRKLQSTTTVCLGLAFSVRQPSLPLRYRRTMRRPPVSQLGEADDVGATAPPATSSGSGGTQPPQVGAKKGLGGGQGPLSVAYS
jgi:hypothetical protein